MKPFCLQMLTASATSLNCKFQVWQAKTPEVYVCVNQVNKLGSAETKKNTQNIHGDADYDEAIDKSVKITQEKVNRIKKRVKNIPMKNNSIDRAHQICLLGAFRS